MGFRTSDVTPLSVSSITPASKDVQVKAFQVSRTDTTATIKAMLPGDSTIVDILIVGVASNAVTTATVSVGNTITATEFINAQDVKTAGGMIRPLATLSATTIPNLENPPISTDIPLYAKYAETGGASTAGGPYTVLVFFVR